MKKIFLPFFIIFFLSFSFLTFAQSSSLSLTITPPLIKINLSPGQVWSSYVKVVNNNPELINVFASVLDFTSGETGGVNFFEIPKDKESEKAFMSQWIEISKGPIEIPPFQSKEIPFQIFVPKEADPGGHYAAILIGNKPLEEKTPGTAVKISSQLSCLILANIEGEIVEKGWIREFVTEKSFYQKPEVKIKLTFENLGNTHLQPKGEIKIYNFLGKERGKILINKDTEFGNVLAKSKRIWNFEWKGERSFFEIGRYKAEINLFFGTKNIQSDSRTVYFWILPIKETLAILGGFTLFLLFIIFSIRFYIKRAIRLAQQEILETIGDNLPAKSSKIRLTKNVIEKPMKEFVVDLKTFSLKKEKTSFSIFFKKYLKFFIFLLLIILWLVIFYLYFKDILKPEKKFEIIEQKTIENRMEK